MSGSLTIRIATMENWKTGSGGDLSIYYAKSSSALNWIQWVRQDTYSDYTRLTTFPETLCGNNDLTICDYS